MWECPACGHLNDYYSDYCEECGALRDTNPFMDWSDEGEY